MTDPNFSRPGAVDLSALAGSSPASGGSYVLDAVEADFQMLANASMQYPIIVEFHSAKDPGGAAVTTALTDAVNAAGGRFQLARVDVDAEPRLAQALGVQAVPTVVALIGGQLAPLFQGTRSPEEIGAVLDQVAQAAVANGMTGRATPTADGIEGADPATTAQGDPRFTAADEALAVGDYAKAVAEFDVLLSATPNDPEVIAGRAQAALLARSVSFDPQAISAKAAERPDDVAAQLDAADLEVIKGAPSAAFQRLLALAAEVPADQRDPIRVRLLELFEVVGRTDPDVLKARRRLSTVLF